MIKYCFCFFLSIFSLTAIGQNEITGVVLDSKNKPVKSIEMQLKGRLKAIRTSSKGTFEFKNVKKEDTLFVYPTKKLMAVVPITGSSPTCTLHLNDGSLSYVYGDKKITCLYVAAVKRAYNNSSIITSEQIQELDANNLIDILRGSVAGLQIDYADGKAKALIRGGSSFSLSNEPLFIVGTIECQSLEGANSIVSPRDIREIEVQKDGSQYGMKGANGVIIIRIK